MRLVQRLILVVGCLLMSLPALSAGEKSQTHQEGLELFEKKIRPLLVAHCYECHSAEKKIRGGLRLDSRAGWEAGGDSGEVIAPGKPEESSLIQAIRYSGDLKMPPKGKLPEAAIRDLEEWVKRGAHDPRIDAKPAQPSTVMASAKWNYWSYQPPRSVAPPKCSTWNISVAPPSAECSTWNISAIDPFIRARLDKEHLQISPEADRATLARRAYFDLWGLPPSPMQIDEFVNDTSPEAWPKLIDRLLASPHFGERWGRHWLDVVRFGESLTLRGFVFPEAWRYRDYVIDAFNSDRPYDRFVIEQIAGDLLPDQDLTTRQRNLVATTFLMLGNTNLEEQDKNQLDMDVVDEQLDVIGKSMLGQTIGCARCHDHKFDPISTKDYYALAGILKNVQTMEHANVSKWIEAPIPLPPEQEAIYRAQDQALAALDKKIHDLDNKLGGGKKNQPPKRVIPARELLGIVVDDAQAKKVGNWEISRNLFPYIGEGYALDGNAGKGERTLTFLPQLPRDGFYEVRIAYTAASNRSTKTPVTVFSAEGEKTLTLNQQEAPGSDGVFLSLGTYRFETAGQCFVIVSNEGTDGIVVADAMQFIPQEEKPAATTSKDSKEQKTNAVAMQNEMSKLKEERKKLADQLPSRGMTMAVRETKSVKEIAVHIRGSVHNLGEIAPRGVPEVFRKISSPGFPKDQSGRLELAQWIGDGKNPLTARVMVNRVWYWLFGAGLVRSVDNFGTTGELPSHPELLDTLAIRFVEEGWSVKKLVREIMLSKTYRLSSNINAQSQEKDPENRWLSRCNRRRLDAECLRDGMLICAGALDETRGGPGFDKKLVSDYNFQSSGNRRSVYLPAFRNNLPEFLETFDLADPSLVTGARATSTIAPQALFLMNHPFVREQSQKTVERLIKDVPSDEKDRVTRSYRMILGRLPTEQEARGVMDYLQREKASKVAESEIWTRIVQGLFASSDFRYLD